MAAPNPPGPGFGAVLHNMNGNFVHIGNGPLPDLIDDPAQVLPPEENPNDEQADFEDDLTQLPINDDDNLQTSINGPPLLKTPLVASLSGDDTDALDNSIDLRRYRRRIIARLTYLRQLDRSGVPLETDEQLELYELQLLNTAVRQGPSTIATLVYTTVDHDLTALLGNDNSPPARLSPTLIPIRRVFIDLPSVLTHYSLMLRRHAIHLRPGVEFHRRFYVFDSLDYVKDGFLMILIQSDGQIGQMRRIHPCLKHRVVSAQISIKDYLLNEAAYTGIFGASAGQLVGEVTTWGVVT